MRPSIPEYYTSMLKLVASRSTCPRRQVGAIITDFKGHVLATGYNGVPKGYPHCLDTGGEKDRACPGWSDKSGDTSRCYAIHAEANAILQCSDLSAADTIYCSTQPCFECCKLIANTPITVIGYVEPYPDTRGIEMLMYLGHQVKQLER